MTFKRKHKVTFVFMFFVIFIVIVVGRVFEYVILEFVFSSHVYGLQCKSCYKPTKHEDIPQHLHQVFFFETSPELPEELVQARQTCLDANPSYKYTLWNKTTINKLIDDYYPDIKELYNSYDHWVKRADVARYLVTHHSGGFYADMDIKCTKSFEYLRQQTIKEKKSVVVRMTDPVGFSNDFFAVSRQHPFMGEVISSLPKSNRWFIFPYPSTVLVTGPTYFWGRYLHYKNKNEFLVMTNHTEYLYLIHKSAWHTWDGVIIWYFFNRAGFFFFLVFVALAAVAYFTYMKRRPRMHVDLNQNILARLAKKWVSNKDTKQHLF